MRKSTIITVIILIVLGLGTYIFLANPFNRDSGFVREVSLAFMEDLQFKDFRRSSLYHHKLERDRVDIGRTLERLFMVKPEFLDIMEYRIKRIDVDSTGDRAKVLLKTKFKRLNVKKDPEEGEVILYWIKRHPDCPIGATCKTSQCVDETGATLYKKVDKEKQSKREKQAGDAAETEDTKEPLSCDATSEDKWFMNLDSTLKEKRYNY